MSKTEHQGEYHDDWRPGATCTQCEGNHAGNLARVWSQPPLIGVVPGGSKDTIEHRMHMDFDKNLDAYRGAKAEGLQPKQTTMKAVKEAQAEVKSHEAALAGASKVGVEFPENIPVAAGVDKEKYFRELI